MKMNSRFRGDPIIEDRSFVAAKNEQWTGRIAPLAFAAWLWLGRLGSTALLAMREGRMGYELGHVTEARLRLFKSRMEIAHSRIQRCESEQTTLDSKSTKLPRRV